MGMMLGQWIEFLIRSEPQSKWDWVLPVPIYWWKRMSRRAVVSETLANQVADILQVSMHSNLLYCRRSTEKQGRLPLADRGRNVKGVFGLKGRHRLKGKNILIVDDVMTSGSTLDEATKVCLKAGAAEVSVAVLARGVGGSAPSR
jgi:predicted amidophosphoribosyltransferase